ELQRQAEAHRALAGERAALERECAELRQQVTQAGHERAARETAERAAAAEAGARAERAAAQARTAAEAAEALAAARRRAAELKEAETHARAACSRAEEALAQVTARRDALAELERERVGLAPAAQALWRDRAQFGDAVLGPLSDFVRTSRRDAGLAERLLGDWLHAVLVRDAAAVEPIRRWHEAPPRRGCGRCSRGTRCWRATVGGARCGRRTERCSSPAPAPADRSSAAPSLRRWSRRCRPPPPRAPRRRRRSSGWSPRRRPPRRRSRPRPAPPRGRGRPSSRPARRRATPTARRPTPAARRPRPPPRSSASAPASRRRKRGSWSCTRRSSGTRWSGCASTSGWAPSAPRWRSSRRSSRPRGSNARSGKWTRPKRKPAWRRHANAPPAPQTRPTTPGTRARRWPTRWPRS